MPGRWLALSLAPAALALTLALAVVLVLAPTAARAGREGDHDRARAAVQAGEVLPLPTLLERLQRTHPGQVLELELEREREPERGRAGQTGRWIYEVKLLRADGQLLKLEVDAATAQVLRVRGDGGGKRGRESREAREPSRAASERR